MKKSLIYILSLSIALSLVIKTSDVQAIDFSKNESKYAKLCSSSNLTQSNQKVCEDFNAYLKKKSDQLKNELNKYQSNLNSTNKEISKLEGQLSDINSQISSTQKDITYLENSIKKIQNNITKKESEMYERIYIMQAYYNSQTLISFLFGANGLSDFFSRLNSINDITAYENELLAELSKQKSELAKQKETLVTAKANLQSQKNNKTTLANQLADKKKEQQSQITDTKQDINENNKLQKEVDNALAEMLRDISNSDSGGNAVMGTQGNAKLGYNIAQKAISKIGSPYWWGAPGGGYGDGQRLDSASAKYFDCSGLVAWAHRQAGVKIGRMNANSYAKMGKAVAYKDLQAGDIVAFRRTDSSNYHHIGIYIGNGIVVHASGEGSSCRGKHASQGHVVKRTALSDFSKYVKAYRRLY